MKTEGPDIRDTCIRAFCVSMPQRVKGLGSHHKLFRLDVNVYLEPTERKMKSEATWALLILVLSNPMIAAAQQDYFPLQIGNRWEMVWSDPCPPDTITRTAPDSFIYEITDTTRIAGELFYVRSYDFPASMPGSQYLRINDHGEVITFATGFTDYEYVRYKLDGVEGEAWALPDSVFPGHHIVIELESRKDTVITAAGTFTNCLRFFADDVGGIDDEVTDWFAPGVGPVFVCLMTPHALVKARINGINIPTSVEAYARPPVPARFVLYPNHPNPFAASTNILYELSTDGRVEIKIFDLLGRTVRSLRSGFAHSGKHTAQWDGKNDAGRTVGSGCYFVSVRFQEKSEQRRVVFVR